MGRKHAENAKDFGIVTGFWDPGSTDLLADSRRFNNLKDGLSWCDFVIISSPSKYHLCHLESAVSANKPCLVEKPLCTTDIGLQHLLDLVEQKQIIVSVGQNLRYHPAVSFAKNAVDTGLVGKVSGSVSIGVSYLPDWRANQDHRKNYAADPIHGGVLFDWVHEVDLLHYLFSNCEPISAYALREQIIDIESDEQIAVTCRSGDGKILSNLLLSYLVRPELRRTTILADNGVMDIDLPNREIIMKNPSGKLPEKICFGGEHNDDYKSELQCFLDSIRGLDKPKCDLKEGAAVIDCVLSIRRLAGLPSF